MCVSRSRRQGVRARCGARRRRPDDGTWTGLSIELWRLVAADPGVTFEIREYDLKGLLDAVASHAVDLAVGSLTITAERETRLDFTHPIYTTGLSIAVKPRSDSGGALGVLRAIVSWDLARLVGALLVLLTAIGALAWVFERRKNAGQFGGGPMKGIAAGVWWSAVTLTTVGYGDKSPVTFGGRMLGVVWMFIAIILISSFTASITSTLTVNRLESSIRGPEDLARVRVESVPSSTSAGYLDFHKVAFRPYPTPLDGLRAVGRGEIDAFVYDAPILQYFTKRELGGVVVVLPISFEHQDHGFALPDKDPMREELNRALLTELDKDSWRLLVERYLGNIE